MAAGRKAIDISEWLTPENKLRIQGWCRDGLIEKQIYKNMGIGKSTFYKWKNENVEFAEAMGTSRQQIGAYVNGRHVMSTATLLKMADVLGVTQYELMGTEEDQTIFAIGREVAKSPILKELVKKVVAEEITDKQLNKVVEVITSLK